MADDTKEQKERRDALLRQKFNKFSEAQRRGISPDDVQAPREKDWTRRETREFDQGYDRGRTKLQEILDKNKIEQGQMNNAQNMDTSQLKQQVEQDLAQDPRVNALKQLAGKAPLAPGQQPQPNQAQGLHAITGGPASNQPEDIASKAAALINSRMPKPEQQSDQGIGPGGTLNALRKSPSQQEEERIQKEREENE